MHPEQELAAAPEEQAYGSDVLIDQAGIFA
jgi:hypothetical protein